MGDVLINMQLEKIAALKRERDSVRQKLRDAERGLEGLIYDFINVPHNKARCMKEFTKGAEAAYWPKSAADLSLGQWDCKQSPTGKCVTVHAKYDEICVFCGNPDERK